jgi:1-acyl-sn-glycerol-3-phosphate acyltransferase
LIIIFLYPFISTANLQLIASKWILFILNSLKIICGVTWKIEGLKNIPEEPCVIVSNHQSAWESFFFTNLIYSISKHYKKRTSFYSFFWLGFSMFKAYTSEKIKKV